MTHASRNPRYYMVRDVHVGGKRRKVRLYLGSQQPTRDAIDRAHREKGPELEILAALKKAELATPRFTVRHLEEGRLRHLEELRFLWDGCKDLLTTNEAEVYEREFEAHYIHGTTTIEGNTLSLAEVSRLLEDGILPTGKTLREINEVQNFRLVRRFRESYQGPIDLRFIRSLHGLVMANIDDDQAGAFRRRDDVAIAGRDLRLAPSPMIEEELLHALDEYRKAIKDHIHPFESAVVFHHRFEAIHPFVDGNGRVGREILNTMLMRSRFPRLLFLGKDRTRYIEALGAGDEGDLPGMVTAMADIFTEQRRRVLHERLRALAGETPHGQANLRDFV